MARGADDCFSARGAREPNPAQPMLCVILLSLDDGGGVCEIFVVPQFIIYLGEEWINGCGYRKTMHVPSDEDGATAKTDSGSGF